MANRKRAPKGGAYYYLNDRGGIIFAIDMHQTARNKRHAAGNYYLSPRDITQTNTTREGK